MRCGVVGLALQRKHIAIAGYRRLSQASITRCRRHRSRSTPPTGSVTRSSICHAAPLPPRNTQQPTPYMLREPTKHSTSCSPPELMLSPRPPRSPPQNILDSVLRLSFLPHLPSLSLSCILLLFHPSFRCANLSIWRAHLLCTCTRACAAAKMPCHTPPKFSHNSPPDRPPHPFQHSTQPLNSNRHCLPESER